MGQQKYFKPEPATVRGSCIICLIRPQRIAGRGKYRALCEKCHHARHGLPFHSTRLNYTKSKGEVCEDCGFVPVHRCQLDVDHIDGDKKNNAPSNLKTLCANCHRLKTKLANEWRIREER